MASVPEFIRESGAASWLDKHDLFVPVSGEARLALKKELSGCDFTRTGPECRSNLKPEKTDA